VQLWQKPVASSSSISHSGFEAGVLQVRRLPCSYCQTFFPYMRLESLADQIRKAGSFQFIS